MAREDTEVAATIVEVNKNATAERLESARMEASLRAERAHQEAAECEAAARAEAERLAHATRHAEELALKEANEREHQRAHEATHILKAAQEAEHVRVVHKSPDKADLLRREDVLMVARWEAVP